LYVLFFCSVIYRISLSASEMTYIVSNGALNSTHSLTHSLKRLAVTNTAILQQQLCLRLNSEYTLLIK